MLDKSYKARRAAQPASEATAIASHGSYAASDSLVKNVGSRACPDLSPPDADSLEGPLVSPSEVPNCTGHIGTLDATHELHPPDALFPPGTARTAHRAPLHRRAQARWATGSGTHQPGPHY